MKMLLKSMCGNLTSFIEAMRYPCTHLSCMKMLFCDFLDVFDGSSYKSTHTFYTL